ncbi:hypothetical protein A15D_01875 [Alcanivorax sp. MD8A]|uniref:hypothetical protein n=1 Tax=Alcanivorax sp. MD8A TaxID=1177157 RepID=UPI000C9B4A3F|nr:hypothetical protein [Alcanivorax sp. MD8A]PNE02627.1 hypothetical protein A15D_01875 [Alcanivorax sp. MD8A]
MAKAPSRLDPIYPPGQADTTEPRFLGYVALFDSSDEILAFGGLDHPDVVEYRTDHPAWAHRFATLYEIRQLPTAHRVLPMALYDSHGRFVLKPTECAH